MRSESELINMLENVALRDPAVDDDGVNEIALAAGLEVLVF